jgi:L-amino acid N-acyltransferase YncA
LDIREASAADAGAIVEIYNHFILTTTISFEEDPVSEAAMRQRIAEVHDAGLPWLVATLNGKVAAFAYATKWRARPAYRFAVETSVYVHKDRAGSKLGSTIYRNLVERLRVAGLHLAIGGIALPNEASVALHEKMGFRKVAHFEEVGRKFDRWVDVGYWQLTL